MNDKEDYVEVMSMYDARKSKISRQVNVFFTTSSKLFQKPYDDLQLENSKYSKIKNALLIGVWLIILLLFIFAIIFCYEVIFMIGTSHNLETNKTVSSVGEANEMNSITTIAPITKRNIINQNNSDEDKHDNATYYDVLNTTAKITDRHKQETI